MVDQVFVDNQVARYALQLVQASRNHNAIDLGISPRGGIAFLKGAKALALTEGRTYVTPQDLQRILPAVFGHRLLLKGGITASQESLSEIMKQMIQRVPVPVRR